MKRNTRTTELTPIDSAPKNKWVLLFAPSGYIGAPWRVECGRWNGEKDRWEDHAGNNFEDGGELPTHWFDIPEQTQVKRVAVVVDNYKLEEFKRTLDANEFVFDVGPAPVPASKTISVDCPIGRLTTLADLVRETNRTAQKRKRKRR